MQVASPVEPPAVDADGLIIASALPNEVEDDRVSAMSAAMWPPAWRAHLNRVGRGSLEVYIKGGEGFVILTSIGSEAVLTALDRMPNSG